jgi:hypothetical protein
VKGHPVLLRFPKDPGKLKEGKQKIKKKGKKLIESNLNPSALLKKLSRIESQFPSATLLELGGRLLFKILY